MTVLHVIAIAILAVGAGNVVRVFLTEGDWAYRRQCDRLVPFARTGKPTSDRAVMRDLAAGRNAS